MNQIVLIQKILKAECAGDLAALIESPDEAIKSKAEAIYSMLQSEGRAMNL